MNGNLDALQRLLTSLLFPELPATAAEDMLGEMPTGWSPCRNLAEGPAESEIWWAEQADDNDRRS